jgi:hypothetical protein
MKAREIYRRLDGNYCWPGGHDNSGIKAQHEAEDAAKASSDALLEKLNSAFFKFAWKHRISEEEARFLLLNTGIKLPKPFMLVAA